MGEKKQKKWKNSNNQRTQLIYLSLTSHAMRMQKNVK